jgi:hypothetical protein
MLRLLGQNRRIETAGFRGFFHLRIYRKVFMDEILAGVLGLIVIQTGRIVVGLLSFGRWGGEPLFGNAGRIYGAAGALWFFRDGKRVITDTGLIFFGIAFYAALLAGVVAYLART